MRPNSGVSGTSKHVVVPTLPPLLIVSRSTDTSRVENARSNVARDPAMLIVRVVAYSTSKPAS